MKRINSINIKNSINSGEEGEKNKLFQFKILNKLRGDMEKRIYSTNSKYSINSGGGEEEKNKLNPLIILNVLFYFSHLSY